MVLGPFAETKGPCRRGAKPRKSCEIRLAGNWGGLVTSNDRYDASDLPEAQFEPGSKNQVLRNRIGITSKPMMDNAESRALEKALDLLVRKFDKTHGFTTEDLCDCHRIWLGDIYD